MSNIYEIFESMREYQVEHKYNLLQESLNTMDIILEANEEKKEGLVKRAITFIKDMWKKFVDWLGKILKRNIQFTESLDEALEKYNLMDVQHGLYDYKNETKVSYYKHEMITVIAINFRSKYTIIKNTSLQHTQIEDKEDASFFNKDRYYKKLGVKNFEEIAEMVKQDCGFSESTKREELLYKALGGISFAKTVSDIDKYNDVLEFVKKDIDDFSSKEIKLIESNPNALSEQMSYFKEGVRVLSELIRSYEACVAKVVSQDTEILKRAIHEYEKIINSKEYKNAQKRR